MPNDQYTEADIISADEWNSEAEDGFITELPSGKKVKVRRTLDLTSMLTEGQIPNPLRGIIVKQMQLVEGATPDKPGPDPAAWMMKLVEGDQKPLEQFMDLLNRIVCRVMVQPPVTMPIVRGGVPGHEDESAVDYDNRIDQWVPDPGTVSVFNVDITDKMYLFALAQGAPADLASFREEQAAALPAAPDGKRVPRTAKRAAGAAKKPAAKKPAKKAGARKSGDPRKSAASKR